MEKQKGRAPWHRWRSELNCILRKCKIRVKTGFIWLGVRSNGEAIEPHNELIGFTKAGRVVKI